MEDVVRSAWSRSSAPRRMPLAWAVLLAAFMLRPPAAIGQTKSLTISVNDYRPLRNAVQQIQTLSGIPANYEDVRCDYPGDQFDKTAGSFTPAQIQMSVQSGYGAPKLVVPRGGSLAFEISVDASTGRLPDFASTQAALESALAAYNSSSLPGKFHLDAYNGEFIVAPIEERNSAGATVPASPVLAAPVMLPSFEETAMERLDRVLVLVTQGSGYKVGIGTVPISGMAMTHVDLSGGTEPASHLLIRLLNRLMGYASSVPAGAPALAYHVLYDVQLKYYMFNVVEVGHENPVPAPLPPSAPTGAGRPGIGKPHR